MSQKQSAPSGMLAGQRALVTGAAGRDIGQAIARRFLAEGATVVLLDRSEFRLQRLADSLTDHATRIATEVLDLRDVAAIPGAISSIEHRIGGIDILVNNAGITHIADLDATEETTWDEVMTVNLKAPWLLTKAVAPGMKARGSGNVINITSTGAYVSGWREGVYGATKAALNSLTRDLASELGPSGVRCNAIAPAIVRSKFMEDHWDMYEPELAKTSLRRFVTTDEVANTALFLASEMSSGITGEVIVVSTGWFMAP